MSREVSWSRLLITDGSADFERVAGIVEQALDAGLETVMLREKALEPRIRRRWVEELVPRVHERGGLLIVSEDIHAARRSDGVHLSYRSPSVPAVRRELGDAAWIGVSTHDEEEVARAFEGGADYVTFGPVFAPSSKPAFRAPHGIEATARVVRQYPRPVFALGGIDLERAQALVRAGVSRIAFIGAVFSAADPSLASRELARPLTAVAREGQS